MALLNLGCLGTLPLVDKKTQTWLELAEEDLEFAGQILKNRQRPYFACNHCHQAVEKILKALVQEESASLPPRTHNLVMLAKVTSLKFSDDQIKFLLRLNPHYMGTRYPDDLSKFRKQYTAEYATGLFEETKELFQWIKNYLIPRK